MFTVVKVINLRLHHMFDTSEMIEEESSEAEKSTDDKNDEASKTSETATSKLPTQGYVIYSSYDTAVAYMIIIIITTITISIL